MKEKSIGVSKRDRQLLSILLSVLILFLLYMFLAGPAYDTSVLLNEEIISAEVSMQRIKDTVAQAPDLKVQIDTKHAEFEDKYQVFLYELSEAKILYQIDGIITETGFVANSYLQSNKMVSNVDLPKSVYMPNTYPLLEMATKLNTELTGNIEEVTSVQTADTSNLSNMIEQMDITIGFSNIGYQNVYTFMKALEDLNRSFIVSSILLAKDQESTNLVGQIMIRSMALPKINASEADDMYFEPVVPRGKTSPFN
jgi:hypothetical protein